ncbi:nuclease-related domain-containing protein [Nitrospina sp. 32_T5]|uniref:nuclease-related domain-containing protein n=1 Tax=unclassified Nitrospina TaxID=2638683 RepID=UPI003F9A98E1
MEPISTLLVLLLVGGGIWFFLKKGKGTLVPGPNVVSVLRQLGNEYKIIENATVPTPDGIIQIDYLVVSPYGLFVINERNDSGRVRVQAGQREWEVRGMGGGLIYNPLWRNRQAINHIENKLGDLPIASLVVFPNAKLEGIPDGEVVTGRQLLPAIRKARHEVLSEEQQESVLTWFGGR